MLTRVLSALGFEKRATDYNPAFAPDNWGRAVSAPSAVTPGVVLSNLSVATRCVSLRSELLAAVPLKLYRRLPNGDRERVADNPLADVLSDIANPLMTAYELREFLVRSLDQHGNGYARIERDGAGQVTALWPLHAPNVQVERLENGRIRYRVTSSRAPVILLAEEMLHIRASSDESGLVGKSPISIARDALGLAINLNETAATAAASGFKIAGVLSTPGRMSAQAADNLTKSFEQKHSGAKNTGKVLLLEEGTKFTPTTFSASDSELLESRKLSAEDVARIFGVPPASVGISNSVSYGSAQQAAQDLVSNCLSPLASRVEQAMQRCLLSSEARRSGLYIEHDLSGLLRGETSTRWNAYRIARETGALAAEEIRRLENYGPKDPSLDYTPLNQQAQQSAEPKASIKP